MKKYRKRAKLTQEKLAELCDTDYRYIGQIETGRRCPSLEYIERIAVALNIAPYRLFYNEAEAGNESITGLHREQKQKLKAMLFDNISYVCSVIDEQY
ncbi:MAG: helix-turn-helix domain-containing protein [Treponema sp.]|nr:helix-turn-helix domain-containing protein [Treponema sp.]